MFFLQSKSVLKESHFTLHFFSYVIETRLIRNDLEMMMNDHMMISASVLAEIDLCKLQFLLVSQNLLKLVISYFRFATSGSVSITNYACVCIYV